eukprot:TRINITY_DN11972_c0_g1_i1.p1 TRINITY_DN11972_c0_g1~~TRINITY_DN11972_c0_g1_i1.p1  ORF type:complete len:346 (+),score=38.07 TRINITY_DN11972_c0_g1_i1:112-1149(+)
MPFGSLSTVLTLAIMLNVLSSVITCGIGVSHALKISAAKLAGVWLGGECYVLTLLASCFLASRRNHTVAPQYCHTAPGAVDQYNKMSLKKPIGAWMSYCIVGIICCVVAFVAPLLSLVVTASQTSFVLPIYHCGSGALLVDQAPSPCPGDLFQVQLANPSDVAAVTTLQVVSDEPGARQMQQFTVQVPLLPAAVQSDFVIYPLLTHCVVNKPGGVAVEIDNDAIFISVMQNVTGCVKSPILFPRSDVFVIILISIPYAVSCVLLVVSVAMMWADKTARYVLCIAWILDTVLIAVAIGINYAIVQLCAWLMIWLPAVLWWWGFLVIKWIRHRLSCDLGQGVSDESI